MMPPNDALIQSWTQTVARRRADAAIYNTRGEVLRTFAQINDEARDFIASGFDGLNPGDVIGIQAGNHPSWPALFLACLNAGIVALPLERSIAEQERDAALNACRASAVVTSGTFASSVVITRRSAVPTDWRDCPPSLLKLTSGTTAAPRVIRFRSHQLLADCEQVCDTMGISDRDLNFAVIPVSHSYGFSNLVTPLIARGVPVVLSSDPMPRAVLDGLARTRATVFPGMPVFYQAFAQMGPTPELPALRLCISAGAPLPLAVAQQFREVFGRAIHSFYGSSECGGICYDREAQLEHEGFVGEPMQEVQIEALDPQAATSRVRVRSAAAGDGYFPNADETRLGNGCFVPDDLLAQRGAGFAIVGRASDIINVAGKKVNPAEVEAVLLGVSGVREAAVFGITSALRNEEVAACVVADDSVREEGLLKFCRSKLSGWQAPKRIFFVPAMPTNERGKISRRALAQRFAS